MRATHGMSGRRRWSACGFKSAARLNPPGCRTSQAPSPQWVACRRPCHGTCQAAANTTACPQTAPGCAPGRGGPGGDARALQSLLQVRHAEVAQLQLQRLDAAHKDVVGLDIAVHDALVVQVLDGAHELQRAASGEPAGSQREALRGGCPRWLQGRAAMIVKSELVATNWPAQVKGRTMQGLY